jgi:hypothetical protein
MTLTNTTSYLLSFLLFNIAMVVEASQNCILIRDLSEKGSQQHNETVDTQMFGSINRFDKRKKERSLDVNCIGRGFVRRTM